MSHDAEKLSLLVEAARNNLVNFQILTDPRYHPNWHHDVIGTELEKIAEGGDVNHKIVIITVPPRHGKSQQASIDFPAWYLGKNPTKEIITASYSGDLAQDFGAKTREKINSEEFKVIFPDVRLKEDERAKGKWRVEYKKDGQWFSGGTYTSVGVGGPITGRGAHILLIDDPIKNREEAESEVYRDRVWDWFTSTAFTRLEPKGVVVVILTRWHQDDLAGRMLENEGLKERTKLIRFPALAIEPDGKRQQGEPLWPDRYDFYALSEIKDTIGPYDFEALYQGSPILTVDQEFKKEWYKEITEEELEGKKTTNFLTIDTAMSKKAQADYCGFCDNSVDKEDFWNLRAWRARLGPEELVDNIFALHEKRKYTSIGIERTAYFDGLKPFLDSEQRKRARYLPIVELKHRQVSKEIRVRSLIPRYSSGSIRHVKGRCRDLEEEQMNFPNGLHDDVLDATAYQSQVVAKGRRGITISKPKYTSFNKVAK